MESYQKTCELLKQLISSKQNLANTLVDKGEEASLNDPFDELVDKAGNYVPKTLIFVDSDGTEVAGTIVDEEVVIDATTNDVREGKVFVSELGVKTGEKFIPSYVTTAGYRLIPNGSEFEIPLSPMNKYEYTKLEAIICPYQSSVNSSVLAEKVSIDGKVYATNSTDVFSTVVKDSVNKRIDFAFVNDSGQPYVLRYFTYKEIY